MQYSKSMLVIFLAAVGVAQACSGNSKANEPCEGTGYCGDPALDLCGSAGFVCQDGTCKKIPGVYCVMDAGECESGSTCVSGPPTVGNNYGPAHCS